ncbi:MAG: ATPase [Rhodobacteraceae bacterium]|nr:MAG: ATPase [Paracoccaceae bacterium]
MIYNTAADWNNAAHKNVALFGMSGLGKTYLSDMLHSGGEWYHYSVDYRIGTHYMDDYYGNAHDITFENLAPLSSYLGKPGNPDKGGIAFEEYIKRQRQHRVAEIAALKDTAKFVTKAQANYAHFICDTSGSICEVVAPDNPQDPVLTALSAAVLPVWIRGDESHTEELVRRFSAAPKPMYYDEEFLRQKWTQYLAAREISETDVDPDDFILWGYREQLDHRLPRYEAIAKNWGVTITANEVAQIRDTTDFTDLIAKTIDRNT